MDTKPTLHSVLALLADSATALRREHLGNPTSAMLKSMESAGLVVGHKVATGKRGRPPVEYVITDNGKTAAADASYTLPEQAVVTPTTRMTVKVTARVADTTDTTDTPKTTAREAKTPGVRAVVKRQQRNVTNVASSGDELTIITTKAENGFISVKASILDDSYTFDNRYGSWQFNDPSRDGARRDALPWVAAYLSAKTSNVTVEPVAA